MRPAEHCREDAVTPQEMESRMFAVQDALDPAERFLHLFAQHLGPPIWYASTGTHVGFRYTTPDARHFCLLKGVRAVSGISACIHLTRGGYTQEVAVIIRTVVECANLIEWVKLAADPDGSLREERQRTYVKTYFDDYQRDRPGQSLNLKVRQEEVHEAVGNYLDDNARKIDEEMSRDPAKRLMSNVYLANSSYVHARYPEVMDMFGGHPRHFHLHGMRGTPKDLENCEVVETYATTVEHTIAGMALHFQPPFVRSDQIITSWLLGL